MRICYLPCDFDGSGSYRCLFPAQYLRERGHWADIPPYIEHPQPKGGRIIEFKMEEVPEADVYVLQRRMEPQWQQITKELRSQGKVVVGETDDYFLGVPAYNAAFHGVTPYKRSFQVEHDERGRPHITKIKRELKYMNKNNMHAALRACNAVTVSTNFLAESYSRFNTNIHVLPNRLHWPVWENVEPQYEVESDRVRIGWMGKLAWRRGDLNVLRGMIGPFMRRHPECVFVAAGENDMSIHDYLEIPEDQRIVYGEAPFPDLPSITAVMDIGLVPLEMNNFNEAKSHLKGLEYAASGVPCIASPTESYRDWVEEGVNGFLARKPKHWVSRMEALVSDDDLRRDMGRAARAKAERTALHNHIEEWENLYGSLLGAGVTSNAG